MAQVSPNEPFKVLVENFSNVAHRRVKPQVVATVLPHPTQLIPTHEKFGDVVGMISDEADPPAQKSPTEKKLDEKSQQKSEYWAGKSTPTEAELDLDHVDAEYRERLRKILTSYSSLWDGKLG